MPSTATLQQWLCDAELAYHELVTGGRLIEGRHSMEVMRFSQANIGDLAAYIADLKAQLQAAGVAVSGGRIRARNIFH